MSEHSAPTYGVDTAGVPSTHDFYKHGTLIASLESSKLSTTFEVNTHFKATPDRNLEFYNSAGELVGSFDFSGSEITFSGNADESAKIFIAAVAASQNLLFRREL